MIGWVQGACGGGEGGVGKIKSKKFIIKYMARPQTFMRLRVFNLTGKKLSLSGLVRTY